MQWRTTFFTEGPPVKFWTAFLKDMQIGHVFHIGAGNGAVAIASAVLRLGYDGVSVNDLHKQWLDNILDKAVFAVVALNEGQLFDKATVEGVSKYFPGYVADAKRYILSGESRAKDRAKDRRPTKNNNPPVVAENGSGDDESESISAES